MIQLIVIMLEVNYKPEKHINFLYFINLPKKNIKNYNIFFVNLFIDFSLLLMVIMFYLLDKWVLLLTLLWLIFLKLEMVDMDQYNIRVTLEME